MHGKRIIIWDIVLHNSSVIVIYRQNMHTGIELSAANTSRNFPKPPAGSKAIFKGPPAPNSAYACFQAAFPSVPENRAAPSVSTNTVGTTTDISSTFLLKELMYLQIPRYVAQNMEDLEALAGILTL
jgi:hypothetical protein